MPKLLAKSGPLTKSIDFLSKSIDFFPTQLVWKGTESPSPQLNKNAENAENLMISEIKMQKNDLGDAEIVGQV